MTTTPVADATGFQRLTTAEVTSNIVEDLRGSSEFGDRAQVGADKVLGQIVKPVADRIGEGYELTEAALVALLDPDTAVGAGLDIVARLRGLKREPATESTTNLLLGGTDSTEIPASSRVRVPDGSIWETDYGVTISGGAAGVTATCQVTGAVEAGAGTITEIVDTISGWTSVTNPLDAEPGNEIETDESLRLRIRTSAGAAGNGTVPAIGAALMALDHVTVARAIENDTHTTDSRGIPPHHTRVVVHPETAVAAEKEAIARILWLQKGTGMGYDGDVVYDVTDDEGYTQQVKWAWPELVQIYWEITVTPNAAYPSNGDDLVEDALLAYGAALTVGADVLPVAAIVAIMAAVPGIDDLEVLVKAGGWPAGTDDDPVAIDWHQKSDHDSTRVQINS